MARRVRCLVRVNSPKWDAVPHEPGEIVEMPTRMAASHVEAGNVVYVDDEPAPEPVAAQAESAQQRKRGPK